VQSGPLAVNVPNGIRTENETVNLMTKLLYRPVDKSNWTDLEALFESKGGPHNCWCMVWRNMNVGTDRANKSDKKASLENYVAQQNPVGLLCYDNARAIAWCSIAPRESYRELSGDNSLTDVWSLVCFFIMREYRQRGIAEELIEQAIKYAKDNGAKYVEAYPVDPESPSYRFMGFKPMFDKFGFELKHKAGQRRYVMTVKI
jgi:GNAT superfamily N-acetyltransferase